jgi:hypothetical protein
MALPYGAGAYMAKEGGKGCLHGQTPTLWPKEGWPSPPTGEAGPLAIPHLRTGAYMAKEGVSPLLWSSPYGEGAYMAKEREVGSL